MHLESHEFQPKDIVRQNHDKSKLCNIDLLRGIAAVAILFWHYQHFYFQGTKAPTVELLKQQEPWANVFNWFYFYGLWGVQFFWILSGFVFFHVYRERREISAKEFVINRFSRLYPLHFLTLLMVAVLQWISWKKLGNFQIYRFNDLHHFVLNIFMASEWGFQKAYSFNGPIWSVSVEILIYGAFFIFLKTLGIRLMSSFTWFLLGALFLRRFSNLEILQCFAFFGLGGLVQEIHVFFQKRYSSKFCLMTAGLTLVFLFTVIQMGLVSIKSSVQYGLFPVLIWFAGALDASGVSSGRIGIGFGKITYSSYLIHVPIQIMIMILFDTELVDRTIVNHPLFLIAYLSGTLFLARVTYVQIERPLQNYFKSRLTQKVCLDPIPQYQ